MKEFYVYLNGTWSFDYLIEANTKEEAINSAIEEMHIYLDVSPICFSHHDQYVEEKCGSGPSPGEKKVSEEFFQKICGKFLIG